MEVALFGGDVLSGLELKRCSCDSRRVCAIRICNAQFSLLLINVYLPREDDGNRIHELGLQLAVIEDLINSNQNCHIIYDGNYNVDFYRNWQHTHIVNEFCDNNNFISCHEPFLFEY